MKITIYKTTWYPTLDANVDRQAHHHFTYLFYQLANTLKKQYKEVTIVDLPYLETEIEIFGNMVSISDCETIITVNDKVILLTFSDMVSKAQQLLFHRNNPEDLLVWSNYKSHEQIYSHVQFQIKAAPYVARYATTDMDVYYHFRQTTQTNDVFLFRGNYTGLPRNVIYSLLEPKYTEHYSGIDGLTPESYFTTAITHRVGLSIAGVAEFCYRDVEYMAIGFQFFDLNFYIQ